LGKWVTRCLISLDHFEKEQVNRKRRYHQAYDQAIRAVKLLHDSNIYTGVTLCVTDDINSVDKFQQYLDFVCQLGIDEIRIVLPIPQGNLRGKDFRKLYIDVMRWTRDVKKKADMDTSYPNIFLFSQFESEEYMGCGAGYTYLTVNNDGALTPCVCVPYSIGNVKEIGLKSAYKQLNDFFKTTGNTCYGRRTAQLLPEQGREQVPYPKEVSQDIMSKCIVRDGNAGFFRNILPEIQNVQGI